jgi:integrase
MAANLRARASDVFRMAETEGHIEVGRNPVTATYAPSREVLRERITLEQFKAIHARAPTWLQRAMYLALLTAQRREDITEMKFADVVDGYLQIVQGKSQGAVRLRQDLRIRLDAVDMTIGDAVAACRDLVISRHLIHHIKKRGNAKKGDAITPNAVTGAFAEARDKAGIVASEGRTAPSFHEIRSLAERLYKEQYSAEFAQAMLGHKQAKTTAKYDDLRGQGWQIVTAS